MPPDTAQPACRPGRNRTARHAWLLLILFGWIGAHRAYLGDWRSAAAIPGLIVLGFAAIPSLGGVVFLLLAGLCVFTDLFRLPGLIATGGTRAGMPAAAFAAPSGPPDRDRVVVPAKDRMEVPQAI